MSLIDLASVPRLAECYPRAPGRLTHNLTAEPLLGYAELARAARALPPEHIERRVHSASNGEAFRLADETGHPGDAIAAGGAAHQWIMLRSIEQLPAYHALLHRLMAELSPIITSATGPVSDVKGLVFISAPGTHTPFHFDAEYSILFQIVGDKLLAAYPPTPPFVDLPQREAYHGVGENVLDWQPGFAVAGDQHLLAPGDGVFLPYAAPHWVRAGLLPSISLSVTWQSRSSRAVADALVLNPVLRRLGLPAYDPCAQPAAPWLRAAASRVGQKIGLV